MYTYLFTKSEIVGISNHESATLHLPTFLLKDPNHRRLILERPGTGPHEHSHSDDRQPAAAGDLRQPPFQANVAVHPSLTPQQIVRFNPLFPRHSPFVMPHHDGVLKTRHAVVAIPVAVFEGDEGDDGGEAVPDVAVVVVVVGDEGEAVQEGGVFRERVAPCERVGVPRAVVAVTASQA
nr:hypothetical protein Itr_chr14CG01210 [Ipomoea trifida]